MTEDKCTLWPALAANSGNEIGKIYLGVNMRRGRLAFGVHDSATQLTCTQCGLTLLQSHLSRVCLEQCSQLCWWCGESQMVSTLLLQANADGSSVMLRVTDPVPEGRYGKE